MTHYNLLLKAMIVGVLLINANSIVAANVKRIIAETDNGLVITVWTEKSVIKLNQDMVFHYTVKNTGKETIYLVTEPNSRIYVESYLISIAKPLPISSENSEYNFNFHEIKQNKIFSRSHNRSFR